MQLPLPSSQVTQIGTLVQLGSCVLVTVLVLGLREKARHREYFRIWSWGWIAISVAIAMVVLRYVVVPGPGDSALQVGNRPLFALVYIIYFGAKLVFFGFVLLGVLALTGDRPARLTDRVAVAVGSAIAAVLVVAINRDLNNLVRFQAFVAVPVFLIAIWRLARHSERVRGQGTGLLSTGLAILVVQWTIYLVGFSRVGASGTLWDDLLRFTTGYNSFLDAGQLVVLGIGMVLTLVEHTHHDAEAVQGERVRVEAAARERLGEILRAAHEGIITLDHARRIDLINPAAAAVLGVRANEVSGETFDRFIAADHREPLWESLAITTRRSEAHPPMALRREVRGVNGRGDPFPLELSVSSFGDGGDRGWVLVVRDLTEQIRARADQERVQLQLAHTARLEAIGRMVSGVAHELNNPLTAIMAFGQDLASSARSDADRDALTVIVQQAERCRVVVSDLLIFARSRREERRLIEPADLIARLRRIFARESDRHQVVFEVDVAADLPPIEVDPTGMEQVLSNVLTNAFQASPSGGRVTLSVAARDGKVTFQIDDTGPGIDAATMPRLFEPFFTTKAPGVGTGLGLSVSHAIVSQHGGTIDVENLPAGTGGGARFRIQLPAVVRPAAAGDGGGRSEPDSSPPPGRVLVVDDEAAIRVAIRRSLERRGWQVEEAGDGAEAWLKIDDPRATEYDVVVTDLRMPGMSGIELVDRLREAYPELADRTIVITGDTASPAVVEFLARLLTPHLQKPFDIRQLVTLVDQVRAGVAR